jgi:hypothetical protein
MEMEVVHLVRKSRQTSLEKKVESDCEKVLKDGGIRI